MVVRPMGVGEPPPLVVVRPGHTAVRQGEPCPDLWSIESGVFAARMVNADGRSFLIDLYGPGDAVGAPSELPSHVTATALRPARLRPLRGEDAVASLNALAARTTALTAALAWFGVGERIERRLVDLACRIGGPIPGGTLIPTPPTPAGLASMVGAPRGTSPPRWSARAGRRPTARCRGCSRMACSTGRAVGGTWCARNSGW